MNYPCLYCIYNTKRCANAKESQELNYCRFLSYWTNEEEWTGE